MLVMLSTSPLIGFIPTRDGDRARRFYEEVLGLRFVSDDGFALVFRTGPAAADSAGIMLRVARVGEFAPVPYTILGWEVAGIKELARHLRDRGVDLQRYSFLQQDADGIWTTPGGDQVLWFLDPDGNTLSLSEHR